MRAKLKTLRMKAGYTQIELAEKLNVTQPYYSMIETGTVPLRNVINFALCYLLKCNPKDLEDSFSDRILESLEENK